MSRDEARSGFLTDAPSSLPGPPNPSFYLLVGDNAYGYSYSSTYLGINWIGDLDTYYMQLNIGHSYTIVSAGEPYFGTAVLNDNVALLNRYGSVLDLSTDYGSVSALTFTATDSVYYIQNYSDSVGYYGLRLINNTVTELNGIGETISGGQIYSARLDYVSDVDIYNFTAVAGRIYQIALTSSIPDLYLDIEFYELAVTNLVTSGNGVYTFSPSVSGPFSLHISSNAFSNTGSYSFIASEIVTPTVSFDTTTASINEGNSSSQFITVNASLSSAATTAVTVPITVSGTATAGTDYTGAPTSITIAAGSTTGSASFSIVGDTTVESNETVVLTMGTPTGATLGTNTTFTETIVNDDVPTVSFDTTTASINEGNSGSQFITVNASLSSAATTAVTVPITVSGSATTGTDYTGAPTSITIAAGSTTGSASFSIVGDTTVESNETVVLTMGTPTGATLGANTTFTETIVNDDVAVTTNVFLDPNFGTLGFYQVGSLMIDDTFTNHFAVTNSGQIYVGGYAGGSSFDFAVTRLNLSGSPDPLFADTGFSRIFTPGSEYLQAIAIQTDGKLLAAGTSYSPSSHLQIVRYLSDGSLDPTFGNSGVVSGPDVYPRSINVRADGEIIINGSVAFSSSGIADPTYTVSSPVVIGQGGVLSIPAIGGIDFYTTQSDGSIFAGASTSGMGNNGTAGSISLWHLNANGTLDVSFGLNGKASIPNADWVQVRDAQFDGAGHIIVTGGSNKNGLDNVYLARLNLDGTLDNSFSEDGVFEIVGARGSQILKASTDEILVGAFKWDAGATRAVLYDITVGTQDITPPLLLPSASNPIDGAIHIGINNNVVLNFSEPIQRGAGTIQLRLDSPSGALVESFDVGQNGPFGGGNLSFSGSSLTINPLNSLNKGSHYFITIDAGAIKDLSNNNLLGISSYDFTTVTSPNLPKISIDSSSASVVEGNSGTQTVTATVHLSSPYSENIVVPISASGSATSSTDYIGLPASVTINAGQTSANISYQIIGDTIVENNESLILTLGDRLGQIITGSGVAANGGDGDDYISVINHGGSLAVTGGAGNDFLVWRGGYTTSFDGGSGYDVLVINNSITNITVTDPATGSGHLDFIFGSTPTQVNFASIEGIISYQSTLPAGSFTGNLSVTLNKNFSESDYSNFVSTGQGLDDYLPAALVTHISGYANSLLTQTIVSDDYTAATAIAAAASNPSASMLNVTDSFVNLFNNAIELDGLTKSGKVVAINLASANSSSISANDLHIAELANSGLSIADANSFLHKIVGLSNNALTITDVGISITSPSSMSSWSWAYSQLDVVGKVQLASNLIFPDGSPNSRYLPWDSYDGYSISALDKIFASDGVTPALNQITNVPSLAAAISVSQDNNVYGVQLSNYNGLTASFSQFSDVNFYKISNSLSSNLLTVEDVPITSYSIASNSYIKDVHLVGSSTSLPNSIDAIRSLGDKVSVITLTDNSPISLSATQLTNDAAVLNKIAGNYTLSITGVTADNYASITSNPHVVSMNDWTPAGNPTLLSSSSTPVDGASAVDVASNISLAFSESIQKGVGTIEIHSGSATGALVESFDIASSTRVAVNASSLTIDPTVNLAAGTTYYVTLPNGAIKDLANNPFAGTTTYDFTTSAPVLPTASFSTTTASINEGNSGTQNVTVNASLSSAATIAITVPITYSGSATVGSDYTAGSSTITFAAGSTTASTSFSVAGDIYDESNETVVLTMGTPTGATLGASSTYTHTILNDDVTLATTSGRVIDGYVAGAKVFADLDGDLALDWIDTNGNAIYDNGEGEPWALTDVHGVYSFTSSANISNANIVSIGGTDVSTHAAIDLLLAAPGSSYITPISTIYAYAEAQGQGKGAAVLSSLGLSTADLSYDPVASLASNANAAQVLKIGVSLLTVVNNASALVTELSPSAVSQSTAAANVFAQIANLGSYSLGNLVSSDPTIASSALSAVLTSSLSMQGVNLTNYGSLITATATAVANVTSQVQSLTSAEVQTGAQNALGALGQTTLADHIQTIADLASSGSTLAATQIASLGTTYAAGNIDNLVIAEELKLASAPTISLAAHVDPNTGAITVDAGWTGSLEAINYSVRAVGASYSASTTDTLPGDWSALEGYDNIGQSSQFNIGVIGSSPNSITGDGSFSQTTFMANGGVRDVTISMLDVAVDPVGDGSDLPVEIPAAVTLAMGASLGVTGTPNLNVTEGSNNAHQTVTINVALDRPILTNQTLSWSVAGNAINGTDAVSGADFVGGVLPTGTLTLLAGTTTGQITFQIAGDNAIERTEGYQIVLSGSSGLDLSGIAPLAGTIANDDRAVISISALSAQAVEGDTGSTPYQMTVTLDQASFDTQTVDWATEFVSGQGRASAADFALGSALSGSVTFAAGETSKTITLNVAGDTIKEGNESFSVRLSNSIGDATISAANGVLNAIIKDDDGFDVGGHVYFWGGGVASKQFVMDDVDVSVQQLGNSVQTLIDAPIQLQNIKLNTDSHLATADLWASHTDMSSFTFTSSLPAGATFTKSLSTGWSVVQSIDESGLLHVSGNYTGAAGTQTLDTMKIGVVTFTTPEEDASPLSFKLLDGSVSNDAGLSKNISPVEAKIIFADTTDVTAPGDMLDGQYTLGTLTEGIYGIDADRDFILSTKDANGFDVWSNEVKAITAADARECLLISLGKQVSAHELIAADVNGSGSVTAADARDILLMSIKNLAKLTTELEWKFVDEDANLSALTKNNVKEGVAWKQGADISVTSDSSHNLVGILMGDLNASYTPDYAKVTPDQAYIW